MTEPFRYSRTTQQPQLVTVPSQGAAIRLTPGSSVRTPSQANQSFKLQ